MPRKNDGDGKRTNTRNSGDNKQDDSRDDANQDSPTTLEVSGVEGVEAMANKTDASVFTEQKVEGHLYTVEYIKTVPPEMGGGDQFFVFKDGNRIAQVVFVNEELEVLSGTLDSNAQSGASIAIDNVLAARQGIVPSYVKASKTS